MLYLALAIAASVTVGSMLKVSEMAGRNRVAVAFINYVVAVITSLLLWYFAGTPGFAPETILCGTFGGFAWVAGLLVMMYAIKRTGVAITSAMVRVAIVVPILLSVLMWNEIPNSVQILGIGLALLAVVLLSFDRARTKTGFDYSWILLSAGVLLSSGSAQVASKLFAELCPTEQRPSYLIVLFIVAVMLTAGWLLMRSVPVRRGDLRYGVMVGVPNALSGLFLISALQLLPAIAVFPTAAAAGVVLLVLLGTFVWKEKLSKKALAGITVAVAAIVLVNLNDLEALGF
ncbi:MAG: EamA family transporter [Planctomycetota bacterium]|nr:EamA family transporter [Planctomycetota bacterium]